MSLEYDNFCRKGITSELQSIPIDALMLINPQMNTSE